MADDGVGAARASQAYRMTAQAAMSPAAATVALHEGLCRELFAAKIAYERKALDKMCQHTTRCTQVLLELRSGLKVDQDDGGARALDRLYQLVFLRVTRALRAKEPANQFQYSIDLLWKFSQKLREFHLSSENRPSP